VTHARETARSVAYSRLRRGTLGRGRYNPERIGSAVNDADRHLLTIFSNALERDPAEDRSAYLDEACAGVPNLRERVEALLRAHGKSERFLEPDKAADDVEPPARLPAPVEEEATASFGDPTEGLDATIGPYRLLQVIGEGGMGTVYLAEQSEPVRRRVALKVVKAGMDTRQVLARFGAERQALAMMEHPNIARVLDAGATPNGRPYFAMELVKGVPITKFCDERKLTPRERLELFMPVCRAVQHAHQKGVIHRDLKPSNVLVALYDDKPVPKVIDFGIAKAAGTKRTEQTIFTEFGAIIGTLEYMSPEQAQLNQLDIDTRSDVYSLGVLLYELLTGTTPMDRKALGKAALLDMLKLIREAETPRPSLRLSTADGLPSIAANRGLEPKKLSGLVCGDLDWIVMKALEKDRSRRYETASALARDLERHLNNEDVEACPPSAAYRLSKFARRHRVGLSVGATVATALVVATAVSTWQAVRATRAEHAAVQSAETERLTNEFFIDDLLGKTDLSSQVVGEIRPDPNIKVRTLVDRAAARIDGRFVGRPLVEAAVRRMIGSVYDSLGLHDQARPHLERAYELQRELLGEDHRATLTTGGELGRLETNLSLYDQAAARLTHTLEMATRRYGEGDALAITTLGILGNCLNTAGRHDDADTAMRRGLELARRNPSVHPSQRIAMQNNHAIILINRGAESQAEAILMESLRESLATVGEDHPMVPLIRINLALIQRENGRLAQADENARKALEGCRRLHGDLHPHTLVAMQSVGLNLRGMGKLEEAEAIFRAKLALARQAFGPESETAIYTAIAIAGVLLERGRLAEAEVLMRDSQGPAHRIGLQVGTVVDGNLGVIYQEMGRYSEAEHLLKGVHAQGSKIPLHDRRFQLMLKNALAGVAADRGRHREAIDACREVLKQCETTYGPEDRLTYLSLSKLASAYRAGGLLDEAEALYPRVLSLGRRLMGPDDRDVLANRQNFGTLLHVRGRFELAEAQYLEAINDYTRTRGADNGTTLLVVSNLGELYRDWGQPEKAEPLLTRALEGQSRVRGADHPLTLWTLWKLAEMDRDRGRLDKADAMFRRCIRGYAKAQGDEGVELATLRADLAMNHLKKAEPGLAEPLLRAALKVYDRQMKDDWRRFEIQGQLGEALYAQKKFDEAEPLILGGYEGIMSRRKKVTVDARSRLPEAGHRVVTLYESWGKREQAATWKQKLLKEGHRTAPETSATPEP
jgi:eukaryotic-like serine/threonine-protein kinase